METRRLIVGGPTSVYPEIEIEILGKAYTVNLTRPLFEQLKKLDGKLKGAVGYESAVVVFEQVEALTGAPKAVIDKLKIQEIRGIINFILAEAFKVANAPAPKAPETEAEVKVPVANPAGPEALGSAVKPPKVSARIPRKNG